jgi:hypothetical protein
MHSPGLFSWAIIAAAVCGTCASAWSSGNARAASLSPPPAAWSRHCIPMGSSSSSGNLAKMHHCQEKATGVMRLRGAGEDGAKEEAAAEKEMGNKKYLAKV